MRDTGDVHTGWDSVEAYMAASSAGAMEGDNAAATAGGECSAGGSMQCGNATEHEVRVIEMREDELPRVQWHHPVLYDTIVKVHATLNFPACTRPCL